MRCKKCGQNNQKGAKYCGYCQEKMDSEIDSDEIKRFLIAGILLLMAVVILFGFVWRRKEQMGTEPTNEFKETLVIESQTLTDTTSIDILQEEQQSFLVKKLQYPDVIDPALITKENAWAVAYLEKINEINTEWNSIMGFLADLDQDNLPELVLYHYDELPPEGKPDDVQYYIPYHVCSVYDYEGGNLLTKVDKERVMIECAGYGGYINVIYYKGFPQLYIAKYEEIYEDENRLDVFTYEMRGGQDIEIINTLKIVGEAVETEDDVIWCSTYYLNDLEVEEETIRHFLKEYTNIQMNDTKYLHTTLKEGMHYTNLKRYLQNVIGLNEDARQIVGIPVSELKIGDTVLFGSYEQDNDVKSGPEPIEWVVVDIYSDEIMIMSKKALDCLQFSDTYEHLTWDAASIRKWLNVDFYANAFSQEEQKRVTQRYIYDDKNPMYGESRGGDTEDRVFLLSIDDAVPSANFYGGVFCSEEDAQCVATPYAIAQGASVNAENGKCKWLLRTSGKNEEYASYIDIDGSINYEGVKVTNKHMGIRPVIWLGTNG